jgi:hypothetical protein
MANSAIRSSVRQWFVATASARRARAATTSATSAAGDEKKIHLKTMVRTTIWEAVVEFYGNQMVQKEKE